MDKEMKKLLLVAVSVGVFLLVTITVALIVLPPKTQMQEGVFSSSVANVRPPANNQNNPPLQPVDIPAAALTDNNDRQEAVITSERNDDRPRIAVEIDTSAANQPAANQPAAATQPAAVTQPAATVTRPAAAPAVTTAQPARTPAATTTAPARPAAAAATPTRSVNDYWIQTGAYTSMVGAEDVRERLASKGLVSIVSVYDDGRTWYRVRLGPYTSQREADHWLGIVKNIDGFAQSQIRQTIRQQ